MTTNKLTPEIEAEIEQMNETFRFVISAEKKGVTVEDLVKIVDEKNKEKMRQTELWGEALNVVFDIEISEGKSEDIIEELMSRYKIERKEKNDR